MLQQILKDMYIDPDVLEALSEDQKKTLFLKMRQEQVRRWKEREEKEDHRPKLSTANRKNVSWLLGRDGDVAVMVIGEVDELKTSKLICSGPVERKAPPSLHNNTRHQTTPPKSNLVNRPVSESVRTGRESLLPKTQPGIQLNLKENTEEVRTLPPLQVSVGEQQPPAALDKQAELKQDLEVDAPEEKPVLSSCRPHSRAGTANPRLDTALSPVPKNFTITPSPVPTITPSPLPSTVTVSPVPVIVTPSPVPRSNAIRDALEKSAAKARASEKTITPSPVLSSVKTSPVPSVSPSPVPSSTPSPVPSISSPSPFHRTIAPSPVASSTAIRDALEKSTTKPHGPEKTTVVPLSVTTRLHPEEPAEPHPQETPSSRDIRVMAAYRRAMSEDVVSEGGGDTCSRSGRVAQLMKNFSVKSPTPPAQIPHPRGSKPPIPTKPNHLHLVASPSLR
uniref:mucin-2-like n=1 Tax=Oncorhynchus gorbuscha TaxID=8017 RepID=UPI001EAE93B2|nr:mucin-2-like [Oncorhynchus gorbuscha]XP_046172263.1 mucin-2-like [Oncorhynchus gorbuscha]XP_046172273.1 mucin-2-like [Oncorhynchus gorbuscha]XP_046172279.1 mucin-2-like [Oncorhynchus gorbuscha]